MSSQDLFRQAGSYETHGQIAKAKQAYGQIVKQQQSNPQDPLVFRSQVRMARLSVAHGEPQAANDVYLAAMKLTPEQIQRDPELMIDMDDLAESYSAQAKGNKEWKSLLLRALELRKKIDPMHPNVNESYRQLAAHSIGSGDLAAAERYIRLAIDRQKSAESSAMVGRLISDRIVLLGICNAQNRWAESEQMTKEMLVQTAKYPTLNWCWPSLRCVLARCYSRRGQYDLSDAEYRSAIDVARKYSSATSKFCAECQQGIKANSEQRQRQKRKAIGRN